jgi:very-short-patch-repair endonuclease
VLRGDGWKVNTEIWKILKGYAREMRNTPTPSENHLWQYIRNNQRMNTKFRRQHAIECFIVDFYASDIKLIIEVDGEVHKKIYNEDKNRQIVLETMGYKVIRFNNDEVVNKTNSVLKDIDNAIKHLREHEEKL